MLAVTMSYSGATTEVMFRAPDSSRDRGFPRMEGPGLMRVEDGRIVLEGKVYRLTAWWLKVFAPLLLLATAGLFLVLRDAGLWIGLGSVLALVAADVAQQHLGRAYRLAIPRGCGFQLDVVGERAALTIQLDQYVVGGGARPPIVQLDFEARHARAIRLLLLP